MWKQEKEIRYNKSGVAAPWLLAEPGRTGSAGTRWDQVRHEEMEGPDLVLDHVLTPVAKLSTSVCTWSHWSCS